MSKQVRITHIDLRDYDDHRRWVKRQELYGYEQTQKPGRDNDRERRENRV